MIAKRPTPPETMFGDDFKSFVPAADVGEWVEATFFDSSSPVANPEHEHLANAHIGYLWGRCSRRPRNGRCSQPEARDRKSADRTRM
ncbi:MULTISPECIES: hypothetical protein [Ensifer]|uniref:hypothetical protein n=1 Tax=Ensifer TaxID=106591 RepID=UPI000A5DFC73|nr:MULTISPECIES: hypothetical protein [Ensifer]